MCVWKEKQYGRPGTNFWCAFFSLVCYKIWTKDKFVCVEKGKKQYGRPGMRNMQCAQHISPFIVSDENFLIWNFFLFFPVLFLEFCQNLSYFPTFSLFGCFCPSCYLQFYSSLSPVFPFIFLFYFIFVNCSFFFSFFLSLVLQQSVVYSSLIFQFLFSFVNVFHHYFCF